MPASSNGSTSSWASGSATSVAVVMPASGPSTLLLAPEPTM